MPTPVPTDRTEPPGPRRWLPWLAGLVLAYAATGLYSVGTNERAVVQRCGRAVGLVRSPGLHFGLPYGIDRVTRIRPFERKRVAVGTTLAARDVGRQSDPQQSECLTGDSNLIHVTAIVQYRIADARAYLFNVVGVADAVSRAATGALASVISGMAVDEALTVGRIAIQVEVQRAAQETLDRYQAGAQIASVSLTKAEPPPEVADAFRDVTAAREDQQRAIKEAEGYAFRLIPRARGEAERSLIEARAYADEVVKKAEGDAARFLEMAAQMERNRHLTATRLILETLEEVLPKLKKIVIDRDAKRALDLGLIEATDAAEGRQ